MQPDKSTNVRASKREWLSHALEILGNDAPAAAAAIAAEWFLAAPRRAKFAEEEATFAHATRSIVQFDGETLPIYRFGSGPSVLLLHGWGGSSGQLHRFVGPLLERGRSVVTFDAPGHGDATGSWLAIPRFAEAIRRVAAEVGPLEAVIGHSMGGAAAAYATSLGLTAERFVLIGPPASEFEMFKLWATSLGFNDRLIELTKLRVEARVGIPFGRLAAQPMAATVHSPMLVIHDREDREVPFADGVAFAEAASDGRLLETSGLGHRRILRDPRVIEATTDFAVGHHRRNESTKKGASIPAWM